MTDDETTPSLATLEEIEDAMRAQLAAATDALNVKRREIGTYEEAVKRLSRSLAQLTGTTLAGDPVKPAGRASAKDDRIARWQPKPATLEKVLAVFQAEPAAKLKLGEVAERAGVAGETARAAVRALRESEQIRQAGAQRGKTGQTVQLYALMNGSDGAA